MIELTKGEQPQVLATHAAQWTNVLLEKSLRGEEPTKAELSRYNLPAIKAELIKETHGKCAYCESKFRHVTFGDVEHIVPKSVAPELRFKWENLTIACDVCNTHKGRQDGIVDPYLHAPADHMTFEGPLFWPHPGSSIGLLTESILQLNRLALVERRLERLTALRQLIALAVTHPDPLVRQALRNDILSNELGKDREYAGMCQAVVSRQLPPDTGTTT